MARGSMGSMVGINTGCRRHLRRRWCRGKNGDAGEREEKRMGETVGSKSPKGIEPFLFRFTIPLDPSKVFENFTFLFVYFQSGLFKKGEI